MNRLLVALLAAFDAVVAAAGGLAVALAPLTLLWVFGFGQGADWGALWPASAVVWQLGHLVPVGVTLPDEYLAATGIDASAATFAISLAPLAFAVFTALFAARSGGRAAQAGVPLTGPAAGIAVFAAISAAVALTGRADLASVELWQAVLLPSAVFAVPCVLGAVVGAWRYRIEPLARLREIVDGLPGAWSSVPGLIVRGAGVTWTGLVGVGALVLAAGVFTGGAEVVALFQAGNVDVTGAVVLALAQLAYLPTLVAWGLSFAAGPGFALGVDGVVSPAGTQLGVLPGVPALGLIPDSSSPWLLLLVLLPVGVGVLAGWVLRSRLVRDVDGAASEAFGPRLAVLGGLAVLSGAFAALIALCAAGAIGPGRLAEAGPEPGPLALAVGLEIAVGAGILLLAPRRTGDEGFAEYHERAVERERERPDFALLGAGVLAAGAFVDDEPREENPAPTDATRGEADDVDPGFALGAGTWSGAQDDTAPIEPLPWPEPHAEVEADAAEPADAEANAAELAHDGDTGDGDAESHAQATEPILGFERGSTRSPDEGRPGSSVD